MRGAVLVLACGLLGPLMPPAPAQTSYSMISGIVIDAATGAAVPNGLIECLNLSTGIRETSPSDDAGRFTSSLLSPGIYRVTASAPSYQDRMADQLDLAVAGHLDLRFEMWKLSDPWHTAGHRTMTMPKSQAVTPFYGPDINIGRSDSFAPPSFNATLLEAARSYVVSRDLIAALPLSGRDVYAALAVEPGVVGGTTTARGLSMSVNGQRPTSTEFLLDGLENDNYLTTGPLVPLGPETVQEYRLSTANFAAPYGDAAGFVANAISIPGGPAWHGLGYFYLRNQALTAADPQRKAECGAQAPALCVPRPPLHELESGFRAAGPLWRQRLFNTAWFDIYRYRSANQPQLVTIPAAPFLQRLAATPSSEAARWIAGSGLPVFPSTSDTVTLPMAAPVLLDRISWLDRIDYTAGTHRLFARGAHQRSDQPGFVWSPYPAYSMPLVQSSLLLAGGDTWLPRPSFGNELRAAFGSSTLRLERTQGVPQLESNDGTVLPGSPFFYSFRNSGRHAEVRDNVTWISGSHILRAGAGVLERWIQNRIDIEGEGYYQFQSLEDFANLAPVQYRTAVDRIASLAQFYTPAQPDRSYRYAQADAFVQDTIRLTPRLALNLGFRLEHFGGVLNTGSTPDTLLVLGSGDTLEQRIKNSTLHLSRAAAYPGTWNPAGRLGLAWAAPFGATLRAGYGIYYDRPFDNLWITVPVNATALAAVNPLPGNTCHLDLIPPPLDATPCTQVSLQFPRITWVAPDLKAPRIQSAFLSLSRPFAGGLTVELTALGSEGRRLITSNVVNRQFTTTDDVSFGRSQTTLPDIVYRANQGNSDHVEFGGAVSYRFARGYLQAAYTLSQTFDNQSDAVSGDFDFGFTASNALSSAPIATFTEQFDSRPDRARSDLDQRHNFVFLGTWNLPNPSRRPISALLRDWTISGLLALRSGLPFSVIGNNGYTTLLNNRADLIDPAHYAVHAQAAGGGIQLLDPAAFSDSPCVTASSIIHPMQCAPGNSGRNAFRSPGLFSADLSLSRTIPIRETILLVFRADAFNFLNHPNLGQPDNYLDKNFGVAPYGRRELTNGFPGQVPFVESPRSIQMMVRLEF